MIRFVDLHNFKCFQQESFRLGNLTLISGMNGVGKSSLIQSLLLLRQSYVCGNISLRNSLRFSGDLVNIGFPNDVRYADSQDPNIGITIENEAGKKAEFVINASVSNKYDASLLSNVNIEEWKDENLFQKSFAYLYAERMSPQETYMFKRSAMPTDSRLGDMHGNNTVFCLQEAMNSNVKIFDDRFRGVSDYINSCVAYWLSYIMGIPLNFRVDTIDEQASLLYIVSEANMQMTVSPLNMAFGPTYIFPIVVGVLTAEKGSLFIVENPEAHLHPSAQTRMGEFLAMATSAGVQVIIETHSDHLMNGIRLAVKKHKVDAEDVLFYSVDRKLEDGSRQKQMIEVLPNGELPFWPNGFFDEWEKSLFQLLQPEV